MTFQEPFFIEIRLGWFIFFENMVKNTAYQVCHNRKSTENTEHHDHCRQSRCDGSQEDDSSKNNDEKNCER